MTNKNLTQFTEATSLGSGDQFHITQGGVDKRIPASVVMASYEAGSPFDNTPLEESTTSRMITLGDRDAIIQCLNDGGCTITLPNYTDAPFPIGAQFTVKNDSNGTVTFATGVGVSVRESTTGLTMPTKGQTATFVNVGKNIWNMISGGGSGGGGTSKQRFSVTRTTSATRTGTGSANVVADSVLQVNGLLEGKTYKVTCVFELTNVTGGGATTLYFLYTENVGSPLMEGNFLTHIGNSTTNGPSINNDISLSAPQNTLQTSGLADVTVMGELTIPPDTGSIRLYWDPVEAGEEVRLREGATLLVEEV